MAGYRIRRFAGLLVLLTLLLPVPARAATMPAASYYTIADLGVLPGDDSMAATGINALGQVVGIASRAGEAPRTFLADGGQLRDLGYFGGTNPAINDRGHIATGALFIGDQGPVPLPFSAYALNNRDQVAGGTTPSRYGRGYLWEGGTTREIIGRGAVGMAINDAGQVAARVEVGIDGYAVRFDLATGQSTPLDQPGFPDGRPQAINSAGQIVGSAYTGRGVQPVLWRDGTVIALSDPAALPNTFGTASDINDAGQIVGTLAPPQAAGRALLWEGGQQFDLNALIPADSGWTLTAAGGINNAGQIVGTGTLDGHQRAFLLTPRFRDVALTGPYRAAILDLAGRGIVRGYGDGTFGTTDPVLRAQAAGLVARAVGWDGEDWPDASFPDQGVVDDDLWRAVRTLAHYQVALGYADGSYDPTGTVTHEQLALLIARARGPSALGRSRRMPRPTRTSPPIPTARARIGG